ncbi:sugar porter family MFS transporter [Sporolactobacillus sp. THM7-7]|nr:sugar porter family MFS transporter [Sporolactobacillus sp. THM7-7]
MCQSTNVRLIFFFGSLGNLLYGYDTGVVSGALLFIGHEMSLNHYLEGLIVSILLFGAIFGALFSGRLSDRIGRKRVFIIISVIYIVGALGSALAPDVITLILARAVLGVAVGGSTALVPVYLSEMAPADKRGKISTLSNMMVMFGILLAYIVDYLFIPIEGWRWMFGLAAVPAALLLFGTRYIQESPRWLIQQGKTEIAIQIMKWSNSESETKDLLKHAKSDLHERKYTILDLFREKWIRPILFLGAGLGFFQQFIGINTVIYYAPKIFTATGLSYASSFMGTMVIGVLNVIMVFVAMGLIDKIGRRQLLIIGSAGTAVSLAVLTVMLFTAGLSVHTAWITVCLIGLYIIFFQASWGPVPWVMMPEIFPSAARGAGTGFAALCVSASNVIVSFIFPSLLSMIGPAWVFTIFAVLCVCSLLFAVECVPETKGRSLEEIEDTLRNRFSSKSGKGRIHHHYA